MSQTQPLRLRNGTFLIERLAADCGPDQWKRELTQNAIEAVTRALESGLVEKGEILWDLDWPLRDLDGLFKLAILDNGDGMTGDEMTQHINELSSSGGIQSLEGNYGVGAKITAGVRNPAGLDYVSVTPGTEASSITFWKDETDDVYGLKQVEFEDGTYGYVSGVTDEYVQDIIREHGTSVTLWGRTSDENTYLATAREGSYPTHHLSRYLNTRYFEIDPRITLRVREFSQLERPETWTPSRQMAQGAQLRQVRGMKYHLDTHADAQGSVDLGDAIAFWWILPDDRKVRDQLDLWQTTGHVAAIYQNELYETRTQVAGRRMLQAFGVTFGFSRVVIYVKPHVVSRSITTDTARSRLILDGISAPWDVWAQKFSENLSPEIEQLINDELASANGKGEAEKIRERLKDVRRFFRLPRYRRSQNGTVPTRIDAPGGGEPKPRIQRQNPRTRPLASDTSPGNRGRRMSDGGDPSDPTGPHDDDPQFVWVSVAGANANAHREPDEMEDRAATYIRSSNLIKGNADFRGFRDLIDHFSELYSGKPGSVEAVRKIVYEWFEQLLIEAVLGARSLEGSQLWTMDDLEKAVSDEALTTAVAPRWHVYNSIRRTVGSQLGAVEAA